MFYFYQTPFTENQLIPGNLQHILLVTGILLILISIDWISQSRKTKDIQGGINRTTGEDETVGQKISIALKKKISHFDREADRSSAAKISKPSILPEKKK
jgi:hypothetical protein